MLNLLSHSTYPKNCPETPSKEKQIRNGKAQNCWGWLRCDRKFNISTFQHFNLDFRNTPKAQLGEQIVVVLGGSDTDCCRPLWFGGRL